jgi:hypothetical protein
LTIAVRPVHGVRVTVHHPTHHDGASPAELEQTATAAVQLLAARPDPEAFQALLRLSALVGESLGVNARALADSGSWAKVAEVAGTSRQAAWSRWST